MDIVSFRPSGEDNHIRDISINLDGDWESFFEGKSVEQEILLDFTNIPSANVRAEIRYLNSDKYLVSSFLVLDYCKYHH